MLDGSNTVVELQNAKVFEVAVRKLRDESHSDVIEFDRRDDYAIFDDSFWNVDEAVDQRGIGCKLITPVFDDCPTDNEEVAGMDLDELIYYPKLRCSELLMAGKKPERIGFDVAYVVVKLNEDSKFPETCNEGKMSENIMRRKKEMKKELQSQKMKTRELAPFPSARKVVKNK